ncbi:MAG: tRNA preQ1(34) S-adenosylmethionine ribosyltransferase-isomerase QueA, partial [Thermodesulfobacteriota bacterium]
NWKCLVKNPRDGIVLLFDNGVNGKLHKIENNQWLIEFDLMAEQIIDCYGRMPLPPYIRRESEEEDKVFYQTVFAKINGSIAAPTAGLHFTNGLLKAIRRQGVDVGFITLHVGVGTFKPVKAEKLENHVMDSEYREINERTAKSINRAKIEGRRIIAVGTTVIRALESSCVGSNGIKPISGRTDLFIYPGFNFRVVDALITNFHLPRSTLLMLVSAFAGKDFVIDSYRVASEEKYRFLSYGDAMFII